MNSILQYTCLGISIEYIVDTFSYLCTRKASGLKRKNLKILYSNNLMSRASNKYLRKLICYISCWIPLEHAWCHIRAKYLCHIVSEPLPEITCLCTCSGLDFSFKKNTIYLYPITIALCCKPEHLDTISIRYSVVSLVFTLPCRDDDNSICYCIEESPDDTILSCMIKVWRIECSSIHNYFIFFHILIY